MDKAVRLFFGLDEGICQDFAEAGFIRRGTGPVMAHDAGWETEVYPFRFFAGVF